MTTEHGKGFTIIELTLAMTFVSILLVSVAMLSIQLINQYTRGATLKEVNQAGTEVINDIKRTMGQAQLQDNGVRTRDIRASGNPDPIGKVLCIGNYSYIASNAVALEEGNGVMVGSGGSTTEARMAKVRDMGGLLCSPTNTELDDGVYENQDVVELLPAGSRLLAVRDLTVSPNGMPTDTSSPLYAAFQQGRGFYTITLQISAGTTSEMAGGECRAPSDTESNINFCAIDVFKFSSRVGSSSGQ